MKFALVALVLAFAWIFTSCGQPATETETRPPPAAPDDDFAAVQPAIKRACGGCHDGKKHPLNFNKPGVLLGVKTKAKARIEDGTMPPAGSTITNADEEALLDYL